MHESSRPPQQQSVAPVAFPSLPPAPVAPPKKADLPMVALAVGGALAVTIFLVGPLGYYGARHYLSSKRASAAQTAASANMVRKDLSSFGLPLAVSVPACAELSKPIVTIADNARDVTLTCPISDAEAFEGKQAFAIQIGLAAGKLQRDDIATSAGFVRFTKSADNELEFDTKSFTQVQSDFIYRSKLAGAEYACFPRFATKDIALLESEQASCRSLSAQ